ncbi:hypothetical protein TPHA_0E00470 [Tetrapisispora phaffii CBS 4417]|uniref:Uncharacterized protein n=1 Tax=Tetrapisispora phaffii (strain ATCC 24235 / CBS 4417 / NBRC 1672 / NRRL Y-8282 / UCD 70-5) TaxID=1071381 RepID=G8BTB5_TETPH|nr:hypothetical protein TPHA_0E00470 [Tetrapisispora phaffii CBS 4417]CCE63143.1 hypothetical protein TPHA_0E00470 [Tetrapisispora phaffii CBS 4417]
MERIARLEEEHVKTHSELLKALDTLYLLKKSGGKDIELNPDRKQQLETRTKVQLSLQKSIPLLRSINSVSNMQNGNDNSGKSTTENPDIPSAEKMLANRLGSFMEEDYEKTQALFEAMNLETEEREELQREQQRYEALIAQYKDLASKLDDKLAKQKEMNEHATAVSDEEYLRQNETMEQLLLALKIHGGYLNATE